MKRIVDLRAYVVGGADQGADYHAQSSGHWITSTVIATPMSKYAEYQKTRESFGIGVLAFDVGKALLAVGVLPGLALPLVGYDADIDGEWLAVACAVAVVVGHVYPVWYEFRGGKGAATLLGTVAVLAPTALLPFLAVWLACVLVTGYVGLGTMLGVASLPLYFAWAWPGDTPLLVYGVVMTVFVAYTHRANIQRMRAGNENRARRLWLLRPR